MGPEATGLIGIVLLLILFVLRMPVAFAMALVGFSGFAYLNGIESALTLLAQDIYETLSSYPLSVIPMFILMGSMAYASGISQRLYKTCYTWLGHFRGGLTVATVVACSGFAAICGSTAATAATMGGIALPEMKKYGYNDQLATGTVASAGTLGILIPPSTVLIVYGILTEESIGKLFISGILPGFIMTLFFVITVVILCLRKPGLAPAGPRTSLKAKLMSLGGIVEAVLLFLLTIGGLFLGWFSPTQAGSIGAFGAFLIGLFRGKLRFRKTVDALRDGIKTSCMVLFIITGAAVFGHFLTISNIPFMLADWVGGLPIPPMAIMGIIVLIYFVGGFFMDSMALIVVTIPIFFPIVTRFNFDPIWFGVIIVMVGKWALSPPQWGSMCSSSRGLHRTCPCRRFTEGFCLFWQRLSCLRHSC